MCIEATGRWVRVGRSDDVDPHRAGAHAAIDATGTHQATLYLVFAGRHLDHERLLAGVTSVAPAGSVVIGCTMGGSAATGAADDAVLVMAIGGPGIAAATRCVDLSPGDSYAVGEEVAGVIGDVEDRGHTVLLVLSGGSAAERHDVVLAAQATAGAGIAVIGGCVDAAQSGGPALFHATSEATRVGPNQVIGVAISSVEPIGVGVETGSLSDGRSPVAAGASVDGIDDSTPGLADGACRHAFAALNGAPAGVLVLGDPAWRLDERIGAPVAACPLDGQFVLAAGISELHRPAVVALAIG